MKKVVKIILLIFSIVVICSCFPLSIKLLSKNQKTDDVQAITLIEIWQIDMFEGGFGSRKAYIKKCANSFEKNNKNVKVSVVNKTQEGAIDCFNNGVFPDIISYGKGLDLPVEKLNKIVGIESLGEKYNKDVVAVAWAVGGYAFFSKDEQSYNSAKTCYVSQGDFNCPLVSYYLQEKRFENVVVKKPVDAYSSYLNNEQSVLLGTQRDAVRLSTKGVEFVAKKLDGFSDVIQYASILSENKVELSNRFLKFLIEYGKENIDSIKMLSPLTFKNINDNSVIGGFFNIKIQKTISIFYKYNQIKELNRKLKEQNLSEQEKLTSIENMLKFIE